MGLFMDMLNTENRKRAAREEYEREHPQSDYSSGTSRPRRVQYLAYCQTCGAESGYGFWRDTPGEAIKDLQSHVYCGCGQGNHKPAIRERER